MNAFSSSPPVHAAIIGAGPYGLSLAAHLHHARVPFRIFGVAMNSWATQMPAGMKLKSDGFASNLSSPDPYTLEEFSRDNQLAYHPTQTRIPVETFVAYGQEFARRRVPTLESVNVTSITRDPNTRLFHLTLDTGETLPARNVILATGLSHFSHVPPNLAHLPADCLTHTSSYPTFASFSGKDVTVLGRGASSLDAAALLNEAGARVTLISRHPRLHIPAPNPGGPRSLYQRLRHPASPLGSSLRSWLFSSAPGAFRTLPPPVRRLITYKHLGPKGEVSLHNRIHNKVALLMGYTINSVDLLPSKQIQLTLRSLTGETRTHLTQHIIAGTGFRVDVNRLTFLAPDLRARIRHHADGAPILNRHFQSTVPNLFFLGAPAAATFGPLNRFVAGAAFTATRLAAHLAAKFTRHS